MRNSGTDLPPYGTLWELPVGIIGARKPYFSYFLFLECVEFLILVRLIRSNGKRRKTCMFLSRSQMNIEVQMHIEGCAVVGSQWPNLTFTSMFLK